jgi:protein tyrosine/serine phosphatase
MTPTRLPPPETLARLLERFDAGPYPMLVHCEHGIDRSGLAAVVWLVVFDGVPVSEARARELSWRTGHISFGQAHAMSDFFDLYERTADGADLRTWIRDTYPRLYAERATPRRSDEVLAHDRG